MAVVVEVVLNDLWQDLKMLQSLPPSFYAYYCLPQFTIFTLCIGSGTNAVKLQNATTYLPHLVNLRNIKLSCTNDTTYD